MLFLYFPRAVLRPAHLRTRLLPVSVYEDARLAVGHIVLKRPHRAKITIQNAM